ncbi:hypothetical protein AAFF_G00101380 [Aldrovandia affinis]|uniref:Large ribosomal subunit protein eL38 n=1 Tax=Aldrovandia affinis TaxID=143900 RepID=A0AAD7RUY5_9TELE|nr:hypothetical protein AAFF_G00101380 [Aldrovandia affinis]
MVHDMVHRVTKKLLKLKNHVIHFPSHADLENVGNGFAQLAGSQAFSRVVGSTDGCQPIVAPGHCSRYLYTLVITDKEKAEKLKQKAREAHEEKSQRRSKITSVASKDLTPPKTPELLNNVGGCTTGQRRV